MSITRKIVLSSRRAITREIEKKFISPKKWRKLKEVQERGKALEVRARDITMGIMEDKIHGKQT